MFEGVLTSALIIGASQACEAGKNAALQLCRLLRGSAASPFPCCFWRSAITTQFGYFPPWHWVAPRT
ncbi:hypothetical protein [Pantoea trifolii]|uniref:Uncharacterized protein n=1 Tax=Pantoea trifolii TaxID=2968030 RepID=A0ABT1VS29_9GAMM|nr:MULTISPECIES: hypothetical protein [unclassified Pantoea]MCQ8229951.1 hypothetical protein [Pantoea sp. MMK2]MCQ8238666.1 hypothetical protein [Pantoea sp. MMK3]